MIGVFNKIDENSIVKFWNTISFRFGYDFIFNIYV